MGQKIMIELRVLESMAPKEVLVEQQLLDLHQQAHNQPMDQKIMIEQRVLESMAPKEELVEQQLLDLHQQAHNHPMEREFALMIIDWKACIIIELAIDFFSSLILWF